MVIAVLQSMRQQITADLAAFMQLRAECRAKISKLAAGERNTRLSPDALICVISLLDPAQAVARPLEDLIRIASS